MGEQLPDGEPPMAERSRPLQHAKELRETLRGARERLQELDSRLDAALGQYGKLTDLLLSEEITGDQRTKVRAMVEELEGKISRFFEIGKSLEEMERNVQVLLLDLERQQGYIDLLLREAGNQES